MKEKTLSVSNKNHTTAKKIFLAIMLTIILTVFLSMGIFFAVLYLGGPNPDIQMLKNASNDISIFDNEDKIVENTKESGYAKIQEIPKSLSNAFVAVEDKRFYKHHGIDYARIAGAIANNLKGNRTQGASTITQQLVKNTYLSSEQTFDRKFKEMQMAIKLERKLSKDEIMEKYLNMLYFGSGEYGVKNASKRFFDKELNELNILECAMLAGIVKSPTKYNPINNYDNSIERTRLVLRLMHEQGYITDYIYNSYKNKNITIKTDLIENSSDKYYLKNAIYEACKILDTDEFSLRANGIKIYTYLDSYTQKLLHSSIHNSSYYNDQDTNSLGILCDNITRGIKAFSSRKDVNLFEYFRQVGSTIKPLACYAPALDQGLISPLTRILDEKTDFIDYSPSNYNDIYYGNISIEDAVAKSLNIPAVKTLQNLGIETSINYLNKMDIPTDEKDSNLALALGGMTYGMSMIDLLGGYTTLANYGSFKKPSFIRCIKDKDGNILYEHNNSVDRRVFDEQSSYLMTTMLQKCAKEGTAKKLNSIDFDIACKTGTVSMSDKDYNSDIYSVGYTSLDTFLFWQGDNALSASHTGGGVVTLMAKNFLDKYYSDIKPIDFAIPQGVKEINIDRYSYENLDKIIIASDNAPKSSTITMMASQKCMPYEKDLTYDRLMAENLSFSQESDIINISFDYNPKLSYKIYQRTFIEGEKLIYNIKNQSGHADINIKSDSFLGSKITVIPYYVDDDNKEIIGTPSKYYSTAFAKRLLK